MAFVGSIDQGTTSSRFLIFNAKREIVCSSQKEHRQITTGPGYLEHDPVEIYDNVCELIEKGMETFRKIFPNTVVSALGITNQRETTVAWDVSTGKPLFNAIVWSDGRTSSVLKEIIEKNGGSADFAREKCGLPVSTYFSAVKMYWMIKNVTAVQLALQHKTLRFGTIDSWLMWRLTHGKVHKTDVTNASRTMLLNLKTLNWDPELCRAFGIPEWSLPTVVSSSELFGTVSCNRVPSIRQIPISGCIGDQQGALVGQFCFEAGQAKNTYGTGCFLLANVGTSIKHSKSGLLATVGFKFGNEPANYALEGSVAGAGSCIQWLRDRVNLIQSAGDSETVAKSVPSTEGVVFVPAFSGLLAPYWDPQARGVIVGITQQTTKAHIVRAALESVAHQVTTLLEAMNADSGNPITSLAVDGGMVANKLVMQLQADLAQVEVRVPSMLESTALGAALCAGRGVGVWDLRKMQQEARQSSVVVIRPQMTFDEVKPERDRWNRAIERSRGWAKL
jgi:glycerol kinase